VETYELPESTSVEGSADEGAGTESDAVAAEGES
jgi:hypothetical protein